MAPEVIAHIKARSKHSFKSETAQPLRSLWVCSTACVQLCLCRFHCFQCGRGTDGPCFNWMEDYKSVRWVWLVLLPHPHRKWSEQLCGQCVGMAMKSCTFWPCGNCMVLRDCLWASGGLPVAIQHFTENGRSTQSNTIGMEQPRLLIHLYTYHYKSGAM